MSGPVPVPAAPTLPALVGLLQQKRLVVCLGTGGVGKTTSAALLALAAARLGRRAVVLTIDPARRLADALGVGALDSTPRAVPQDRLWAGSTGSLHALMLDPGETFDRMVGKLVSDPAKRERLLKHTVYQHLSRGLAGVHEYMALEKLHDLAHDERFDVVVLDTPPSKNALDFLEAPGRAASFFNEKIARFFIPREGKKRLADLLFNKAQDAALSLVGKVVGDQFLADMTDFMRTFQGLFSAFEQRGLFAESFLRGPEAAYVVVTAPDALRIEEALEFAQRLRDFKLTACAFIVNRVRVRPTGVIPTSEQAHDALRTAGIPDDKRAVLAERMAATLQDRAYLSDRDARAIAALRKRVGAVEVLLGPELSDSPHSPEALARVSSGLLGIP
ncbi:MAG: ArsA family ATPase [Deltaproteobacteria bacterium]|nr:ArsA family ATPase [Deltaproteobacteria bacterium]